MRILVASSEPQTIRYSAKHWPGVCQPNQDSLFLLMQLPCANTAHGDCWLDFKAFYSTIYPFNFHFRLETILFSCTIGNQHGLSAVRGVSAAIISWNHPISLEFILTSTLALCQTVAPLLLLIHI